MDRKEEELAVQHRRRAGVKVCTSQISVCLLCNKNETTSQKELFSSFNHHPHSLCGRLWAPSQRDITSLYETLYAEKWRSEDLKDAYFHFHIAPRHRRFLIFAFEGVAYHFTVLTFGLSLAPRTFTSEWSAHSKLSGQLAADGSFREHARCSQGYAYQPPAVFGAYNTFSKKQTPTHATLIPGCEPRLSLFAGQPAPGTCTDNYELASSVLGREVTTV